MRAAVVTGFGGPDVIEVRSDWPEPPCGPADVVIVVAGSGVNPADVKIRRGEREAPNFPYVMGREAAGVVVQVGSQVRTFNTGEHVFSYFQWSGEPGGCAERVAIPELLIARAPSTLDLVDAATIPLAASTALQALRALRLGAGDVLAVVGASGGVGTFAVQLAASLGAQVLAVCGTSGAAMVRGLGADVVLDRRDPCALPALGSSTHLLDLVGAAHATEFLPHLPSGIEAVTTTKAWHGAGLKVRYVRAESSATDLEFLAGLVDNGLLRPVIVERYGLADAGQAHLRMESGTVHGKLVVEV